MKNNAFENLAKHRQLELAAVIGYLRGRPADFWCSEQGVQELAELSMDHDIKTEKLVELLARIHPPRGSVPAIASLAGQLTNLLTEAHAAWRRLATDTAAILQLFEGQVMAHRSGALPENKPAEREIWSWPPEPASGKNPLGCRSFCLRAVWQPTQEVVVFFAVLDLPDEAEALDFTVSCGDLKVTAPFQGRPAAASVTLPVYEVLPMLADLSFGVGKSRSSSQETTE